jgi:FG-GAP repeat
MKITLLLLSCICFFTVARTQNVGIGTITPAEKLHVAGNIKVDTVKPNAVKFTPNAGTGKILTSDAAGNASWQTSSVANGGNVGFGPWGDCSTNGISDYNPVVDTSDAAGLFGFSASISGNYAIVGNCNDDVGANADQGSASIYQYNGSNWVLMQKITDATGDANDLFGRSVSISGNYVIVGSLFDDVGANADQGSASIYQYDGSNWVLMQKITDATGDADAYFGRSVSISGNYVIVGSLGDDVGANANQGSASIYQYLAGNWVLMQKITDATGDIDDLFGYTVSVSGNYAIVGSTSDDVGANANQGSASIYQYLAGNWVLMQKITDAAGNVGDLFGHSVSISGNYAIVGANSLYALPGQGSASIYRYDGTNWVLMKKITEDPFSATDDAFGNSVSISGNYAIVGAPYDDAGDAVFRGAATIYQRVGMGWQKLQYVIDPGGTAPDYFGSSTAIDGTTKRFLIGASGYIGGGKAVFGKVN